MRLFLKNTCRKEPEKFIPENEEEILSEDKPEGLKHTPKQEGL